ncbi:uncharacterized protein LOC133182620 [Saccostrea echinata]|uniref:uncharacterized protein LOC133182620 n=1 Tax=Saccostrea echinata TaxID=191078 RepID=UPI002A841E3A|nr:uncharacterized protein LOC133182620 [Saccostrea echinata]
MENSRCNKQFNTGFNLIIGSNGSGKSVIFEIIRRCLSTKLSATITSTYGESKVSFAVCRYVNVSADLNTMLSGIYKQLGDEPKQTTYVKFVIFQSSEKQYTCCANKYACKERNILSEDTIMSSENIYVTEKKTPNIYIFLKLGVVPKRKDEDAVEKEIINLFNECDFQQKWDKNKGMKGFNKQLFEETLWKLTNPKKKYTLSLEEINESNVLRKLVNINGKGLIRAPEGVIEAVQFALIYFCRDYYTICLEVPDRGMHSHMVERLRDVIYRSKKISSKSLCVEGKEDKILINAIFDYLVEHIKEDENYFIFGDLQISREEIQYFSSHQKVAFGSYTMEGTVRR